MQGRCEAKARVEYRELAARSLLNRCSGTRMPFDWTINPYRGCEFGCKYCYARYTHEFMELREPEDFERRIFAKEFDAAGFGRELRQVKQGEWVAIGTATDPYQPAERRYGVTRKVLEVFATAGRVQAGADDEVGSGGAGCGVAGGGGTAEHGAGERDGDDDGRWVGKGDGADGAEAGFADWGGAGVERGGGDCGRISRAR